ncbi:FG-GAP-like repeat-containing protein [Ignavibacterium sp.]|uniref:FG-GAP repeat domain-containing protein n=1 Tax=Ignavibacterium sp. TaxID=2651167 RepID=UPI00307D1085
MYIIKYLVIIFSLFPLALTAQNSLLEQLHRYPAYEVTLKADSTVEIYNKHHNYRYLKKIRQMPKYESTTQADLVIELDTVNFAPYESLYRRWGNIQAVNIWYGRYTSLDANKNGKNEIYGWRLINNYPQGNYYLGIIYEQVLDSVFAPIYEFQDESLDVVYDVGDITNNGLLDIAIRGVGNSIKLFKQESSTSYINTPNFIYNPFPPVYQPNNASFYDIDGEGNMELIYFLFAGDGDSSWAYSNHVAKYNPQINNYELVYYHRPLPDFYTNGISVGDFDMDGKGNFATGSIYGKFYIYEHVDGTEYQVEFIQQLQTDNAYLTTFTEDLNGNGKPEIWIGGDFASSLYGGVTRLYAFEAIAPGEYEQVYQIDIRGLFSAIDGRMRYADFDGDVNKELFLTNANLSFVFKYDGNGNYYVDFVIPAPTLDSTYTTQNLERIDIADLDGDGVMEIIPQYFLSKGWPESWEYRSFFLKRNIPSDIEDKEPILFKDYRLYQNYPNPFNPETKVKFALPNTSDVKIKVYNILGKEIKEIMNETRQSGEYEITWNGTDKSGDKVPSGVYFITMFAIPDSGEASSFQKTIKATLIK